MSAAMQIRDFRPMRKGSLLGFAKVELPSGMVLCDCVIMSSDRGPWVGLPSKPQIGKDGMALTDSNSRIKYSPVVEFSSKEIRQKFSDAVIEALKATHPEAFA